MNEETMLDDTTAKGRAELMTIGYEGANIGDFLATLKAAGVSTLIDVRELPLSRKKGFSKRALSDGLAAVGIDYLHLKWLGDPKPGREAARAGDYDKFREIFGEHIRSQPAVDALQEAATVVLDGGACLLCFERCHKECHRSIVADEMTKLIDLDLKHIGVRHGLGDTAR